MFKRPKQKETFDLEIGLDKLPDVTQLPEEVASQALHIAEDFRRLTPVEFTLKYDIPPSGGSERYCETHDIARHPWSEAEVLEIHAFRAQIEGTSNSLDS